MSDILDQFDNHKVWERAVDAWNKHVAQSKGKLTELIIKPTHTKEQRGEIDRLVDTIKVDSVISDGDYKTDMYSGKVYKIVGLYLREKVNRQEFAGCINRDIDRYAHKIGPSLLMRRVASWFENNPHMLVDYYDRHCYLQKWK